MFKPSDAARRLIVAHGLAVAAVLVPAASLATVSTVPARDTPARAAPAGPGADGSYQIRCWQHGRLLFEENRISLHADGARQALKITATDGDGRPLYVAETDSATCLIRATDAVSPRDRPDAAPAR